MKRALFSNTQIKIFHTEHTDEATIRANANAVAKALSRLDLPWAIDRTKDNNFVAYCSSDADNAIVLPQLKAVDATRFAIVTKAVFLENAMLSSQ